MEHPEPAAARLADVVRGARRPRPRPLVPALPRARAAERARGDGAPGEESVPGEAAGFRARAVLRLHVCELGGEGEGRVVGPALAGRLFPSLAAEVGGKTPLGFLAIGPTGRVLLSLDILPVHFLRETGMWNVPLLLQRGDAAGAMPFPHLIRQYFLEPIFTKPHRHAPRLDEDRKQRHLELAPVGNLKL